MLFLLQSFQWLPPIPRLPPFGVPSCRAAQGGLPLRIRAVHAGAHVDQKPRHRGVALLHLVPEVAREVSRRNPGVVEFNMKNG